MAGSDSWASAPELMVGTLEIQSNDGHTREVGEPEPSKTIFGSHVPGSGTIWWKYTPSTSGSMSIEMDPEPHDAEYSGAVATLGVYTGASVDALTAVTPTSGQNPDATTASAVVPISMSVTAGTVYYIQVGGVNYSTYDPILTFHVEITSGPANDVPASGVTVVGESFASTVTALDGARPAPVAVAGEPFAAQVVMASSDVTALGEAFAVTATALDGVATVGSSIRVAGEAWAVTAVGMEGLADLGDMLGLWILDDEVERAPTSVQVTLVGGIPTAAVSFDIDGTVVFTATTDSDGALGITSIPVPEAQGAAGAHTLTATQTGARPSSATFTVLKAPAAANRVVGPDTAPVEVPAANTATGVRRWVLQDLMPGGLGSYVMPMNPASMTNPHFQRTLESQHVTANAGAHHVFESDLVAQEWEFTGYCPDQAMHDQLRAFGDLNRRFYVLDHRGRAWIVTFVDVDLRPRLRQRTDAGAWNDWAHDYTVRAVVYDQEWGTPQ